MSGYFSRLAERSGLRIGEAGRARAIPSALESHVERPAVQPLEIDESRSIHADAAPSVEALEAHGETQQRSAHGLVAGEAAPVHAPEAAGPRRLDTSDASSVQAADLRGERVPGPREERVQTPGVVRIDPQGTDAANGGKRGTNAANDRTRSEPRRDVAPFGETPHRDGDRASMEELAVRMMESDLANTPEPGSSADAVERPASRVNPDTREALREVFDWIGTPAQPDGSEEIGLIEKVVSRETGDRVEDVVDRGAAPHRDMKPNENRRTLSERGDAGREPIMQERHGREADDRAPGESSPPGFTLSIGSIRIVIEEPAEAQPRPAPAARTESHAPGVQRSESSRLSRYYI